MSLDLDQVLYARAAWRKAVLVPLWTIQMAVLLCLMGIFAYRLAETFEHYKERDQLGEVPVVEVVWEATNVGFNLISLLLNILEIARKATERLTPFTMVFSSIVKLALALAVLALDIVAYLRRLDGPYSTVGLFLDCGLLAATLAAFLYALTTYFRLRKYEDYRLTAASAKPQPYIQYAGGRADASLERGRDHDWSSGNNAPRVATTDVYQSPYSDSPSPSYPSRPTQPHQPQPQPQLNPLSPTSPATLKLEAERAMIAEFGWGSGSTATATVGRSGSVVVGSGAVPVHHGMATATAAELQRQRSRVTERGVIAEVGGEEGDDDGDEEGEEQGRGQGRAPAAGSGGPGGQRGGARGRRAADGAAQEEDRQALLSSLER